jgi:hypothetical protein
MGKLTETLAKELPHVSIEDVISKVNEFNETTYTEGDDYFGDYGMDMATVSPIVKEG